MECDHQAKEVPPPLTLTMAFEFDTADTYSATTADSCDGFFILHR